MKSLMRPFVNLSTANVELITRFAQSQEMSGLANASARKYFEAAQKTFGGWKPQGDAELVRCLTENVRGYREYGQPQGGASHSLSGSRTARPEAFHGHVPLLGTPVFVCSPGNDRFHQGRTSARGTEPPSKG